MLRENAEIIPVGESVDRDSLWKAVRRRFAIADGVLDTAPEKSELSTYYLRPGKIRYRAGGLVEILFGGHQLYGDPDGIKKELEEIATGGFVNEDDGHRLAEISWVNLSLPVAATVNSEELLAKLTVVEGISDRFWQRMGRENPPPATEKLCGTPEYTAWAITEAHYLNSVEAAGLLKLQVQYAKGVLTGDPRVAAESLLRAIRETAK